MTVAPRPRHVLPVIVLSQFAGTSLWFAGNAVLGDLQTAWGLDPSAVGWLTSSVQLGFIVGTLLFAVLTVADRFPPRRVFLVCSVLGAVANAAIVVAADGLYSLLVLRFATGFFLAGIYPVGMKIAVSWFATGLGNALGLLVGALVLGTAFPHLIRSLGSDLEWQSVLLGVSGLAAVGGVALYGWVPDGPHLPKRTAFDPRALVRIFCEPDFRAAAFGYFGHMWELYAFWAFVPVVLTAHASASTDGSLWSFLIIAAGVLGCVVGGALSNRWGSARVAAVQLAISGLLCLLAPLLPGLPDGGLLAILLLWGTVVVGDSPQFSALNAQTCPRELVGTALTIVTSIGFFLTIPAIQLVTTLTETLPPATALVALAPGPLLGLLALRRLVRSSWLR